MKTTRRLAGLACAAVLTASLLSGCAAANGLSHLASCATLADAATDLRSSVRDATADESDPASAIDTLTKAADTFQKQTKQMRDADVKAKAEGVTASLRTLIADLQQASADPANADTQKLSADQTALTDAASAAEAACK